MGVDGALRVWVEVSLSPHHPSFPGRPQPPPSPRHFCLTLVVELPPSLRPPPGGFLHAAWATPLGCILPTAHWSGLASRVLWLVAVTRAPSGAAGSASVWAVESLAAVRGVPGNVQQHQRPPRAVLWGTVPVPLAPTSAASALSCFACFDGEVPALLLYDAAWASRQEGDPHPNAKPTMTTSAGACVRYTRLSTLQEGVTSPVAAVADNHVSVRQQAVLSSLAHAAPIVCLAPHAALDLAVAVDALGTVLLWATAPIAPLCVIHEQAVDARGPDPGLVSADVEAGGWVAAEPAQVSAACWLPGDGGCVVLGGGGGLVRVDLVKVGVIMQFFFC